MYDYYDQQDASHFHKQMSFYSLPRSEISTQHWKLWMMAVAEAEDDDNIKHKSFVFHLKHKEIW